jgi:peptidoglycan/LPS O-acetylase OafA/YrhL
VKRRFDIQALRAVAVVAVLLFHSGLAVNAGFLGVDVFFVVSGFVVTQLILRRIHAEGTISLASFWTKRVRRLFPGLILMVVVLSPLSLLVFPRLDEASAGLITAGAGVLSLANVATALLEFDYFAAPSKENFMLHLWSLSVEEQFYIFWPLVFAMLWRPFRLKRFTIFATTVAVTSFTVWVIGSTELLGLLDRGQAFAGFFSPISRAWEFLAGAIVALLPAPKTGYRAADLLSKLGWIVMLAILIFSPLVQQQRNASVIILVLSVCVSLRWGSHGNLEAVLQRKSLSWIQFIGDRSYSLYLWHWPLAVFASILFPTQEYAAFAGVLLSIPLSFAAYTFVEQPFRYGSGIGRHSLRASVPSLAVVASLTLGVTTFSFQGVETRVSADALSGELNEDEFFAEMERLSVECTFGFECFQTLSQEEVDFLILGNSHGAHLTVGLARAFPNSNVVWVHSSSVIDGEKGILRILEEIHEPEVVVVSEYLSKPDQVNRVIEWESAIDLLAQFGSRLVITNGSPTLAIPAYKCKYGVLWNTQQHRCTFDAGPNNARHSIYSSKIHDAVKGRDGVEIADVYGGFCDSEYCSIGGPEGIFFRDLNHFTLLGSSMAAEQIKSTLRD